LVSERWNPELRQGLPFSAPAHEFPDFEPGTYVALITYGTEGFHRNRLGDERSFDTVLNTRLFKPITRVRFSNSAIQGRDRHEFLGGLALRLENRGDETPSGSQDLPFNIGGKTFLLPVTYYLFAAQGEPGERRKFVAKDHCVIFTSNGQVHKHWTPSEWRYKTKLKKLADRVLIVVETDLLPIQIRTSIFTADRSTTVPNEIALKLESSVSGFLDDWEDLKEVNSDLIKKALQGGDQPDSSFSVAKQIRKFLRMPGFSLGGQQQGGSAGKKPGEQGTGKGTGGGSRSGGRTQEVELLADPTCIKAPDMISAVLGATRCFSLEINGQDNFIPSRSELLITTSSGVIGPDDISIGSLRKGRARICIAIPEDAPSEDFEIRGQLKGWLRSSGGVGTSLNFKTCVRVLEEQPKRTGGSSPDTEGPSDGDNVAVLWRRTSDEEEWDERTVGEVRKISARLLAEARPEYKDLASLGDREIPTLLLNEEYPYLVQYLRNRTATASEDAIASAKERYAVGTGIGLLVLHLAEEKLGGQSPILEKFSRAAHIALARAVLSQLPAFDQLAKEAGLD
jgi:hypothetical protein